MSICSTVPSSAFGGRSSSSRSGVFRQHPAAGDGGDLFGHHVNMAARVASAAAGGEILVSAVVREMVEPCGVFRFGSARPVALKGIGDGQIVATIEWRRPSGPE